MFSFYLVLSRSPSAFPSADHLTLQHVLMGNTGEGETQSGSGRHDLIFNYTFSGKTDPPCTTTADAL